MRKFYEKYIDEKGNIYTISDIEKMAEEQDFEIDADDLIDALELNEYIDEEIMAETELIQTLIFMRDQSNMTQEEVAKKLNIKQNTYSRYENGTRQIPYSTYLKALELFGYTMQIKKKKGQ